VYYCVLTLVNLLQGVELVFNGLRLRAPVEAESSGLSPVRVYGETLSFMEIETPSLRTEISRPLVLI